MSHLLKCICFIYLSITTLNAESNLRILELMPNLLCPLAVDPALPADFIALSPTGNLSTYDWIYWGPKETLEAYFKDQTSLKQPIIRVKLSANVAQKTFGKLEKDAGLTALLQNDPQSTFYETKWGAYPVQSVKAKLGEQVIRLAWVGLNDPESGWIMNFNLITPNEASVEPFWSDFINKTTPLKDADYFKACGQDLQEGYTRVTAGDAKLKMIAEKRERDGTLQLTVIPESPILNFNYLGMEECRMGAEWKYGEPMVKVYSEITTGEKNWKNIIRNVSSIFYKVVPEFTYTKDEHPLTFQTPAR